MIQFKPVQAISIAASVLFVFLCSCGSQISGINAEAPGTQTAPVVQQDIAAVGFPAALPQDSLQPWEELNSAGFIQNAGAQDQREAAGINTTSEFYYGAQEWDRSASALDSGDIMQLDATTGLSWVLYRMPLGGDEAGVVSLDVNLKPADGGGQSEYWVGLADYGKNTWDWSGPFSDGRVRLGTVASGSDFTSPLGSLFVTVAAYGGSKVDVIGVGASVVDPVDTTAPPQVTGLTLSPVDGGLELTWNNVIAGDLAGYRVLFSASSFIDGNTNGVQSLPFLNGSTTCVLPASAETFVRVAAVDISGNTGPVSDLASAEALAGSLPELQVNLDQASVLVNDAVQVSATGADSFDWDLDGDGVFDLTSEPSPQAVATSAPGIIRPLVRGSSGGTAVAHGAVSLIVAGNSRPVVQAFVDNASGTAPHNVNFSSEQEDFDGTVADWAWFFNGDTTENWRRTVDGGANPPAHIYNTPGLYNAKVRAWDDSGAWDVDSVAVQVLPGANQLPNINVNKSTTSGNAPLTVDFDASGSSDPDGTIVEYAWDWDGDGAFDQFSEGPVVSHIFSEAGSPLVRVRIEDNDGGRDFTQFTITVNAPPVVDLHTDTPKVSKGETVSLIATASDSDGSIVDYEWDLDGNGVFNEAGAEADAQGNSATGLLMGETAGEYGVSVRVTDNSGAQATAELTLTVLGWLILAVDTDGSVGGHTSLAVVFGRPAISYIHNDNNELRYVLAQNDSGSVWNDPVVVDTDGNVGTFTSLEVVNGAPAISYYDFGNQDLKYAYSSSADGSDQADWTAIAVDSADAVGEWSSLAVINGKPAISYYDNTNQDLKYAYSGVADGSSGWNAITIDSLGNVGNFYSSLTVVNGKPAIGYFDNSNQDLKYAYSSTVDGAVPGDWTLVIADAAGGAGSNPSLAVVNGKPAISYRNFSTLDLMYAYSSEVDGSSGWTTLVLDPNVGAENSSLTVVNGKPATSYHDNGDLKYAYSSTVDGSAGWTTIALDTVGNVGRFTSQAVLASGSPAISYYDNTNFDLKYAVLYE